MFLTPRLGVINSPMPIERYFLDDPLQLHDTKSLKDSEFHHLSRVMRARVGDHVELVNGRGILAKASIQALEKNQAILSVENIIHEPVNTQLIILAQALPKLNRLDFILEKGTELGVNEFWLFPGDLSLKKDFSDNQKERARSVTIAAMKQSGRLMLPEIKILPPLEKWPLIKGTAFFGDLDETAPLFLSAWQQQTVHFPVSFFIGPESGWSEREVSLLKEKGAKGVKLHTNILRTDTASLVAISLIKHWLLAQ